MSVSVAVRAQAPAGAEPAAAAPAASSAEAAAKPESDVPAAPAQAEPKAEPKPQESKAEPNEEIGAEKKAETKPETKPEVKPEVKPEEPKAAVQPAKKTVKSATPEEIQSGEFQALKAGAEDKNSDLRAAALEDLRVFAMQHEQSETAPEAWAILAKQEEYRPAMVDWLHLIYEYPQSKFAQKAKSEYLDLVNRKMRSKL
ncbi:MAG: hypothetical protein WC881_00515 [Elusimicrobiota bacterium]